jgi:hypothetical protein
MKRQCLSLDLARLHACSAAQVRSEIKSLLYQFFQTGEAWEVDWTGSIGQERCSLAEFDTRSLGVLAFNLVSLHCLPPTWLYKDALPFNHAEEFSEQWIGIASFALEKIPELTPLASCLSRTRRPSLKCLGRMLQIKTK